VGALGFELATPIVERQCYNRSSGDDVDLRDEGVYQNGVLTSCRGCPWCEVSALLKPDSFCLHVEGAAYEQ
jgi:hypothetical protein